MQLYDMALNHVVVLYVAGNPIASLIESLRLKKNRMVLQFDRSSLYSEDDDEQQTATRGTTASDESCSDSEDSEQPVAVKAQESSTSNGGKSSKAATDKQNGRRNNTQNESAVAGSDAMIKVEINLALSAQANATEMFAQRKAAAAKESKTISAAERALRAVEEQTAKQIDAQNIKRSLLSVRKVCVFVCCDVLFSCACVSEFFIIVLVVSDERV